MRSSAACVAALLVIAFPQEALVSGATIKSLTRPDFRLTLSTPSIDFAMDPDTGHSPEREYHAEADRAFNAALARIDAPLQKHLAALRKLERWRGLIPYDEKLPALYDWNRHEVTGACRVSLYVTWVDSAELELAFAKPPSERDLVELRKAVDPVFAADLKTLQHLNGD